MNLLEFARGPALQWALAIFLVGVTWRLLGVLFLAWRTDYAVPRSTATVSAGVRTVFTRFWPRKEFEPALRVQLAIAYTFHIALAIAVLAFAPHIDFIKGLTGLSWPGLPNIVVVWAGAVTLVTLVIIILRRIGNPVLRMLSDWDDYFSWLVTFVPVVTGLMAYAHIGPRYETMLGIHILSVAVFLAWFPFGKLMHAIWFVPARAVIGAAFERKGVRA